MKKTDKTPALTQLGIQWWRGGKKIILSKSYLLGVHYALNEINKTIRELNKEREK